MSHKQAKRMRAIVKIKARAMGKLDDDTRPERRRALAAFVKLEQQHK